MVKRLLMQSISGPFHNWKSLEMWLSLFWVTSSLTPIPSFPTVSLMGTKLPLLFSHKNGNTHSKVFTKRFNLYFPIQKAKLPAPKGLPQGTHKYLHTHTCEHTKSSTGNMPMFSKHLEGILISRISPSFDNLDSPPMQVLCQGTSFKMVIGLKPKLIIRVATKPNDPQSTRNWC